MARSTTRLEGTEELTRKLRRMTDEVRADKLMEATHPGADLLLREMRAKAPVRTGRGRRNLDKAEVSARSSPSKAEIDVGPAGEGFYLIFSEIGTSRQPATPFMRPALDQSRGAIVTAVRKALAVGILKVAT